MSPRAGQLPADCAQDRRQFGLRILVAHHVHQNSSTPPRSGAAPTTRRSAANTVASALPSVSCRARPLVGQNCTRRPRSPRRLPPVSAMRSRLTKTFREIGVVAPNIRQALQHPRAAEQLGLQPLAPRPVLQQAIHQQLHGMHAEGHRVAAAALPVIAGQQEMVHAANPGHRVAEAGGDAGPQDGGQIHVRVVGDVELALDDVHAALRVRCGGGARVPLRHHVTGPKTASIFSCSVATVKGLTRKLFTPNCTARCTRSLSPRPVSMMNAVLAVAG